MASLMSASQTQVIVFTIHRYMLIVTLGQLLDGLLDFLEPSGFPHRLSGIVGMAASAVPVALEGFGVEGDLDAPHFRTTDEKVAGHPQMVTHRDTLARTDLELPLRGHHFSVDTRNLDASVQAGAVVGFDEVTSEYLSGT